MMIDEEKMGAEIDKAIDDMVAEDINDRKVDEDEDESGAGDVIGNEDGDGVSEVASATDTGEVTGDVADGDGSTIGESGESDSQVEKVMEGEGTEGGETEADLPQFSDEVLERALTVGLHVSDALSFPSEDRLSQFVSKMEQRDAVIDDAELKGKAEETPGEKKDLFADLPKLDPEVSDPEVIRMFDQLTNAAKQQAETIEELRGQQGATSLVAQEAAGREVTRWFDSEVKNLGEDFTEALGNGDYDSLDRGSSQFANCEKIANQMSIMFAGYEAQGLESPPREQVFDAAARFVLQDEYQKVHEKKLAGDLETQASQHIQRTGGEQAASKQSPEEEAAQAVDELLAR